MATSKRPGSMRISARAFHASPSIQSATTIFPSQRPIVDPKSWTAQLDSCRYYGPRGGEPPWGNEGWKPDPPRTQGGRHDQSIRPTPRAAVPETAPGTAPCSATPADTQGPSGPPAAPTDS